MDKANKKSCKRQKKRTEKKLFLMYWRSNGTFEGVCWRVCVSELWYHVNVPPPAPTRTWTLNKRRTAGFYVSNLCLFYFGGSRVSHSLLLCCFVLFFLFQLHNHFSRFLSGHVVKKEKTSFKQSCCKKCRDSTSLFWKGVVQKFPTAFFLSFFFFFQHHPTSSTLLFSPP